MSSKNDTVAPNGTVIPKGVIDVVQGLFSQGAKEIQIRVNYTNKRKIKWTFIHETPAVEVKEIAEAQETLTVEGLDAGAFQLTEAYPAEDRETITQE